MTPQRCHLILPIHPLEQEGELLRESLPCSPMGACRSLSPSSLPLFLTWGSMPFIDFSVVVPAVAAQNNCLSPRMTETITTRRGWNARWTDLVVVDIVDDVAVVLLQSKTKKTRNQQPLYTQWDYTIHGQRKIGFLWFLSLFQLKNRWPIWAMRLYNTYTEKDWIFMIYFSFSA